MDSQETSNAPQIPRIFDPNPHDAYALSQKIRNRIERKPPASNYELYFLSGFVHVDSRFAVDSRQMKIYDYVASYHIVIL